MAVDTLRRMRIVRTIGKNGKPMEAQHIARITKIPRSQVDATLAMPLFIRVTQRLRDVGAKYTLSESGLSMLRCGNDRANARMRLFPNASQKKRDQRVGPPPWELPIDREIRDTQRAEVRAAMQGGFTSPELISEAIVLPLWNVRRHMESIASEVQ